VVIELTEGQWHKKVRLKRISKYEKEDYEKVEFSHDKKNIPLFCGEPSNTTHLSDADIVLFKNGKVIKIVEIQSTLSPKQATGIIMATDLCDRCKIDGKPYKLSDVELIIAYKKQVEKSKKPEQLQLIKDNLEVDGCLKDFDFEEVV